MSDHRTMPSEARPSQTAQAKSALADQLRAYYATSAPPVDEAAKARVIELVACEARIAHAAQARPAIPLWRFTLAQLRFIHPATWILQLALLVGMLFVASIPTSSGANALVIMTAAVLSVAIGLPSVFKSFETGVVEIEYSCRFNCLQVLASRLVIFGLTDVLWLSIAVAVVPAFSATSPFHLFLYACTPFFACCAVCFYLARILGKDLVKAGMIAIVIAVLALWGASAAIPHWYTDLSLAVWVVALAVSITLAAYELRRLAAQLADGLRVQTPLATL